MPSGLAALILPVLIFILHDLQVHQFKQQGCFYEGACVYLKAIKKSHTIQKCRCFIGVIQRHFLSLGVDTDVSVHFRIHIGLPNLLTCACWEALKVLPSPSRSAWIGCVSVSVQVQLLRCCLCALMIRLKLFVDGPASGTVKNGECNHLNDTFQYWILFFSQGLRNRVKVPVKGISLCS